MHYCFLVDCCCPYRYWRWWSAPYSMMMPASILLQVFLLLSALLLLASMLLSLPTACTTAWPPWYFLYRCSTRHAAPDPPDTSHLLHQQHPQCPRQNLQGQPLARRLNAKICRFHFSYPINIQAVVFNRPTLAIFSAGLGEPIIFKILRLVYVCVVNMHFKNLSSSFKTDNFTLSELSIVLQKIF